MVFATDDQFTQRKYKNSRLSNNNFTAHPYLQIQIAELFVCFNKIFNLNYIIIHRIIIYCYDFNNFLFIKKFISVKNQI